MNIQKRLLQFILIANWIIFVLVCGAGFMVAPLPFAWGIFFGGLIVTVNFHLLYRTLKKSLTPPNLVNHNVILAKYYVRFMVSGLVIFFLISNHVVNPLGLFIGLSVVVVSIVLGAVVEFRTLFVKEAT